MAHCVRSLKLVVCLPVDKFMVMALDPVQYVQSEDTTYSNFFSLTKIYL